MSSILIIDDDDTIRTVFERYLTSLGHDVDCAANGKDGLRKLEETKYDLVITDIMMPETDGLEVVMAVRGQYGATPVIAISGGMHAMPMDFLPMARKFGATQVLYKPIELEDLKAAVNEALASSEKPSGE